ncbi:ATP-dependent helicase HrpB OS=Streptomyces tendae OX=1932 GN=GUR47_12515 PE=4 SV=1 [Streptomyces tendae]
MVLATSVAESSLTVPGVRVVVDAGLAREPRVDHARGLSSLTTVRASRAAARQRAGRAGREAPGVVYRCWAEAEDARMPRFPAPEIKVADLTAFALQAACWGDPDASGLALLDPPPGGAMTAARSVLEAVGAVDSAGRATERGARLARLGLHPRLGRALLDAAELSTEMSPRAASATAAPTDHTGARPPGTGATPGGGSEAGGPRPGGSRAGGFPADVAGSGGGEVVAEVVGLLSEEPPREYGDDLVSVLRAARRGGDAYGARWRAEVRRLRAAVQDGDGGDGQRAGDEVLAGLVAALAFPERVARKDGGSYLMVSGTRAELPEASALRGAPWIAVAVADRPVGRGHARVQLAAAVDEETARLAAGALLTERDEVHWADGDVVARRVERLGAVELAVRPLTGADPALVRGALLEGLRREGLGLVAPAAADADPCCASGSRSCGGTSVSAWPDVTDDTLARARGRVAGTRAEPRPAAGRPGPDRRRTGGVAAAGLGVRGSGARARGELAAERIAGPRWVRDPDRLRRSPNGPYSS